jgi:menaquinol-cytochrome c reductase iron-sulfur subunit
MNGNLSRREFVAIITAFLGSIMAFVIGLPGILYLFSPAMDKDESEDVIPLGPVENYPIGIPTKFNFTRTKINGWEKTVKSYGVYVYRKDETQLIVFSDICTHLACIVKWHPDIQEYISPCHDGHFNIEGDVTKGPPPRPLDRYDFEIKDGNLYINLSQA